jgi:hypothetical protein
LPLVFQYGSNCNAERFNGLDRLNGGAADLGPVLTLRKYQLAFNKWSETNRCAAADLLKPRTGGRRVWGVLYRTSRAGFKRLREDIEGPGYRPQRVEVEDATGATRTVTTFRVRLTRRQSDRHTTFEYVDHIVRGLRAHNVPEEYIMHVMDIAVETNSRAGSVGEEQNRRIQLLRDAGGVEQ